MRTIQTSLGVAHILEDVSEFPNLSNVSHIYSDVETTAFRRDVYGHLAYCGHRACGVGITVDDSAEGWYFPLRHIAARANGGQVEMFHPEPRNLPLEPTVRFLSDLFGREHRVWRNHNLKFDARMLDVEGVTIACRFEDTLSRAKVVDYQRSLSGYGQKPLCRKWLGIDTDKHDEVKSELARLGTKDYAELPIDLCGSYCVDDTFQARMLSEEIESRRYEGVDRIFRMEDECSRELFFSERLGVRVDRDVLDAKQDHYEDQIAGLEDEYRALGLSIDPMNRDEVCDFLYGEQGWDLPVLRRTDGGAPSVDALALKMLSELPGIAGTEREDTFRIISGLREANQFISLYARGWVPYIGEDGCLHPEFNQIVRSGRMSCSNPNAQQLNKIAKECIRPRPGMAFLSRDYSQIEYRLICAQAWIESAISAYCTDPTTDFHRFVANLCEINRSPEAKQVNFGISFGMGEPGLIAQLARSLKGSRAAARAKEIYETYQRKFPEIKAESNLAKKLARKRAGWSDGEYGWVATMFGRRRALQYWKYRENAKPGEFIDETRKAFNTRIQGTAADIIKDRFAACARDPMLVSAGLRPLLLVHDELLFEGPVAAVRDPEIQRRVDEIMVDVSEIGLPLPLRVSGGESEESWAAAG